MAEEHEEEWLTLCVHEAAHSVVANEVGFIPTIVTMHKHNGQSRYVAVQDEHFYSRAIIAAAAAVEAEWLIFGDAFGHGEADDKQIEELRREGGSRTTTSPPFGGWPIES
jgi:hypothetical protein